MKTFTLCTTILCLMVVGSLQAQINPYQTVQAESFSAQQGTRLVSSGTAVGYINNGDWLRFDNVNLGGPLSAMVHASSNTSGGTVEFRADAVDGPLIGTVAISNTGGWQNFQDFNNFVETDLPPVTGVRPLYLVFRGGSGYLFDVNYFYFATEVSATGLAFTNCPGTLEVGETFDLEAVLTPANTTNQFLAHYTSDYAVADVNYISGEVTALGPGTVVISATSFSNGAVSANCTIQVVSPTPINPYRTVQAESFSAQQGTRLTSDGTAVGYINNGEWLRFDNVNLGGPLSAMVRASSNTSGGTVEFRADAVDGPLIGTVAISNTGGWQNFQDFNNFVETDLPPVTGVRPLYLVFRGGSGYLFDVNYFYFQTEVVATSLAFTNCPGTLEVGETFDLEAALTPANTANQFLAHYTSDYAVADVNYITGEVTALGPGTVVISATSFSNGAVSAKCTIQVVPSAAARVATTATRTPATEFADGDAFSLDVYPNPSAGTYRVMLPEPTHVRVTDLIGRTVLDQQLDAGKQQLDLTSQRSGVYLLTVGQRRVKLIKE